MGCHPEGEAMEIPVGIPPASALPVSREKPHDFAELLLLGAPGCLRVLARVRGMGNMLHFLTSLISQ